MSYFLTEYIDENIDSLFNDEEANHRPCEQSYHIDIGCYDCNNLIAEHEREYEEEYEHKESSAYPAYADDLPEEDYMSHSEYTEYLKGRMYESNGGGDEDDYEFLQDSYNPPEAIYDDEGNIGYW